MIRLALLSLLLLTAPAAANNDLTLKDGLYYTMDDGIMSPEEMEMEANDMYRLCNMNPYQKTYINCECLAGAFLIQREKDGPMTPQSQIFENITQNKTVNCANTVNIAGNAYESCMTDATYTRELETDNEDYCSCVANNVAKAFEKKPRLKAGYISSLNYKAYTACEDPAKRPKPAKKAP